MPSLKYSLMLFIFVIVVGCSAWFFSQSSNSKNSGDFIVPREPCGDLKDMPRVYEFYCSSAFPNTNQKETNKLKINRNLCKYLLEYYRMCGDPDYIPLECDLKTNNCGEKENDN